MGNIAKRVWAFRNGMEIIHLALDYYKGKKVRFLFEARGLDAQGATNFVEACRARGRKLRKLDTKLWHPMPR